MNLQPLCDQALTFHQQGRLAEAERLYAQILVLDPGNLGIRHLLGILRHRQGRNSEALAEIGAVLNANPGFAEAHCSYGKVLNVLGRYQDGLASFDKALALQPEFVEAQNNRGVTLLVLGRFEEALASFDKALLLRPDFAEGLNNRGNALKELLRFQEALASFDRALALRPDYITAQSNRAVVLLLLGRSEEALESCDRVLAVMPDNSEALNNRGGALQDLHRFEEALDSFDQALTLNPDYLQAWANRAACALLMGRFDEGWRAYDRRKKQPGIIRPRNYPQPEWSGAEDLKGKTLFLYWEQGMGDTLHFCRYAALAEARGARVVLSVQDSLIGLLKSANPAIEVIGSDDVPVQFDYHAPLLSMPLAFQTGLENIPATVPYLKAEPERVAAWGARLGNEGFKIGISWQGKKREGDIGRSFALRQFEGLSRLAGVRLISLQKNTGVEQLQDLPAGMAVETLGEDFDAGSDAFLDTAAVMENLDLVISSDTAMVHLAGALGRPAWVVLQYVPEWRWLLGRPDSVWYPTLRLFRQPVRGDWQGAFAQVEAQLAKLIGQK